MSSTVIPKQPGSQYTNDQREAVIADYAATGNISKTAKMNNLPRTTVTGWVQSDWGKDLTVKIRHSDEQAPATILSKPNGNTIGTDISVDKGSKYTNQQRREAVIEYGIHGNMTKVAEVTGIPETTLAYWKNKTDWWVTVFAEVCSEISDRILPQNLQIAERANERVLDSLENGDEKLVWDKEKKEHVIKRVKPGAYQSMLVSGISQDKARVQLNLPTLITQTSSGLDAMVKKFEAIADAYNERQARVVSVQEKSGDAKNDA